MRYIYPVLFLSLSLFCIACSPGNTPKNRGPILFGDSSLIVTERNPQYLRNNVEDLIPQKGHPVPDTVRQESVRPVDTPKVAPNVRKPDVPEPEKVSNEKGLDAPFKALPVFIANISANQGKKTDWNTAKGASFTLDDGELNNKTLTVKAGSDIKIMQRYQTIVLLKMANGKTVKLPGLPVSTGEWQSLKGSNGKFPITGINANQLEYDHKPGPAVLRNAVQRFARRNRMSRKEEEDLLKSVKNSRSITQSPFSIALQSLVWKIAAKDARGQITERELRIDINR